MQKLLTLSLLALLLGCKDAFEYSPNQTFDRDSPFQLNLKNLKKLESHPADDTVTIAFIGDSQRFYNEVELFVQKVNRLDNIDFVLVAGDISDFGLLQELEWTNDRLQKLKAPYFAVIGNHDAVGNGHYTFERFFGPLNYSFTYQGYSFILHNTNGREYSGNNVPNLNWIQQEIDSSHSNYIIGVSHIPPYDGDFNKKLEQGYTTMLSKQPNFLLSLHGHTHRLADGYPYDDGVRYITAPHFESRSFIKLTLIKSKVQAEIINF